MVVSINPLWFLVKKVPHYVINQPAVLGVSQIAVLTICKESPFKPVPCWPRRLPCSPLRYSMHTGPSRPSRTAHTSCGSHWPGPICRLYLPQRHPHGAEPQGGPRSGGCLSTKPTKKICCYRHATKWACWPTSTYVASTHKGTQIASRKATPCLGVHTPDPTSLWSSSTRLWCTNIVDLGPLRLNLLEEEYTQELVGSRCGGWGAGGDERRAEWRRERRKVGERSEQQRRGYQRRSLEPGRQRAKQRTESSFFEERQRVDVRSLWGGWTCPTSWAYLGQRHPCPFEELGRFEGVGYYKWHCSTKLL